MPMPSAGSVPEPSSSITTRLSEFNRSIISSTFLIWAENVDRFSVRFCPSPISHKNELFMQISASPQVTCSPHWAIRQFRATVFIATVLPPVFGPVITMPFVPFPSSNCSGTHRSFSISGCLASFKRIRLSVFICGVTASSSMLSFPLEKI